MLKNDQSILDDIQEDLDKENFKFEKVEEVSGGKNSKSYCLFLSKKKYFLKFFPKNELIVRDRLNSELNFLRFLNDIGYTNVPKPIFWNYKKNFIVLSWLEGVKIKKTTKTHVYGLVDFILSIQNNRDSKYLSDIGKASEAYFFLNEHQKHIKNRIDLLVCKTQKLNFNKNNTLLLEKCIKSMLKEYELISENNLYHRIIFKNPKKFFRILSPSDIGFHNVLINKADQLLFFDFEYAGWDDPHKTLSDLIIHPEFYIKKGLFNLLLPLIDKYVSEDIDKIRLEVLLKLYRLKWALIILNNLIQNVDNNDKITEDTILKSNIYLDKSEKQINDFLSFQRNDF